MVDHDLSWETTSVSWIHVPPIVRLYRTPFGQLAGHDHDAGTKWLREASESCGGTKLWYGSKFLMEWENSNTTLNKKCNKLILSWKPVEREAQKQNISGKSSKTVKLNKLELCRVRTSWRAGWCSRSHLAEYLFETDCNLCQQRNWRALLFSTGHGSWHRAFETCSQCWQCIQKEREAFREVCRWWGQLIQITSLVKCLVAWWTSK
jgi:hypothetical protein